MTWPSFDGLAISGLVSRPPARFTGKRSGADPHPRRTGEPGCRRLPRRQSLVHRRARHRVHPAERARFDRLRQDLRLARRRDTAAGDSVMDIGALFDWIATQPDLDADRVLVAGRSYGGFMSLAVATTYAPRLVASIAIVAISPFHDLPRTHRELSPRPAPRGVRRRARPPRSARSSTGSRPLSNADRIAKPLLVVAGRNDPRVPYQEGEQIVAKSRRTACRSGISWPTTRGTCSRASRIRTSCSMCRPLRSALPARHGLNRVLGCGL